MNLYCEYCKKLEDVRRDIIIKTDKVKDIDITANIQVTFCYVCNHEIFDETAEVENDIVFFDIYKSKKGLLTSNEIKGIRKRYEISQTIFAKVLGVSEKTVARYETGSIQDISHDNLMRLSLIELNFFWLLKRSYSIFTAGEKVKVQKLFSLSDGF